MLIDEIVFKDGKEMTRWEYIDTLSKPGWTESKAGTPTTKRAARTNARREEIWQDVLGHYSGRLLISAGSDYHADVKKGTKNQRELGKCGLTIEEFMAIP